MAEPTWTVAGDGYRFLRQVGNVFLDVKFGWQGHWWHARRVHAGDYERFGGCRTLSGAKAAAMRVARKWNQEDHG